MGRDHGDPYLAALLEHCRGKPDATESRRWGETFFSVGGRPFAFLGKPGSASITARVPRGQLGALVDQAFVRRARYLGRLGWATVTVDGPLSCRTAVELVDASYRLVGGAR